MTKWVGDNIAALEMGLTAMIMFGFLGWQYWSVRDARRPPPEGTESARAPRHPEGQHQPD